MFSSILLDVLLVLILLMMIPLGFLRGGLREVCTAAGLMFGMLLANEWSGTWGTWLSIRMNLDTGAAQFTTGIVVVVLSGALLGYGGTAAFSYRPGPGGRMYGAYIALFNGVVLIGYLINLVVERVYEGTAPALIMNGYVSHALSVGFGWVLLVCAMGVLAATVFGMFVRERPEDDMAQYAYAPQSVQTRPASAPIDHVAPATGVKEVDPASSTQAPVRIKEIRHWEEPQTTAAPAQGYGSGWRQTWPNPKGQGPVPPWEQRPAPQAPTQKRTSSPSRKQQHETSTDPQDVLRNWMNDEDAGERD